MKKLENFALGQWTPGRGEGQELFNAVSGDPIFRTSSEGLDFGSMLNFARATGGDALRKMTFHERGRMLRALAMHLRGHLDKFYSVSLMTGATKSDSWVDIEGGIGNLFAYASLRKKFPDTPYCVDGETHKLSKQGSFAGYHLMVPKEGCAIHINAYNFPVWGMLEKIAVNLLAGVPAIVKPATVTSYLTEAVVREIDASGILPAGALQLICGSAGDLLDHVRSGDVITFTGSASTGAKLRRHETVLRENVPFTMEADSLNCIVLGPDVEPGMPEWDIFLKEVRREMTTKCGQKCTAIRRIFVPENRVEAVSQGLAALLAKTRIGNPVDEKVHMGSLAGLSQREEVRSQVQKMLAASRIIYGSLDSVEVSGADAVRGAFMSPLLLLSESPLTANVIHETEAFGPVATLMPYKDVDEAIRLSRMGKGSLVSSIVTADDRIARDYVLGAGAFHGRILVLNRDCAGESTGHGSPLPLLTHGGPGRAGGGEEMGGVRGVYHYMQRVAIQGSPTTLTAISQVYQPGGARPESSVHPFRKYFEELVVGETLVTGKRTVTESDIANFANLSWDHFYAHVDHTSLGGTPFEKPVAHGYFILSAAAGLFVDGKKGPVLLNYGIDEFRFTKPVYAGSTIGVKLTVKEKLPQDLRDGDEIPKGIVKWFVEVLDETNETVGAGTILTMVRRKG